MFLLLSFIIKCIYGLIKEIGWVFITKMKVSTCYRQLKYVCLAVLFLIFILCIFNTQNSV